MAFQLPESIKTLNPVFLHEWAGPWSGADETAAKAAAEAGIPPLVRLKGLEVILVIAGVPFKYWYKTGTTSSDLVPFSTTGGTWGTLDYPTWVSGTPFVKMNAAGSFILDDTVYQPFLTNPVTGTGTINVLPKWSTTGSTLADSIIFDNGTSVGIGTNSPDPANKLQVSGIIASTSGINLDTTANTKTGIYAGSNTMVFWAGNAPLATYRLNGNVAGSYFEHTAGFTNNGSLASGNQNTWRLAGSVTATTATNTIDVTQLLINPTYSQSSFGTGKLRGVYYNPSAGVGTSIHRAWENTSGDIVHGNLATGVGVGTRVVTANSVGLLVNDDLVTNFVKYGETLTQQNFAGRTVYVSPLAFNGALFSTAYASTTQAQWTISDVSTGPGNASKRLYQWKNAYNLVVTFTGSISGNVLTTTGSPALSGGMWIRLNDGITGMGFIVSGSGNTWTLSTTNTQGSQTMKAYSGVRNVYSDGNLYFGFWSNGTPGAVTATFKQMDLPGGSIVSAGSSNGSNVSVSPAGGTSYWKVPIPVANYLTDIEVTFTYNGINDIQHMTQEMVFRYPETVDVIPFLNKDGGKMFGTLSFVDNPDGRAISTKGSITNAGALTMATGTFTALPSSSSNTEMVSINSTTGVLSKQAIPTGLPPSGTAGGDLSGTFPSPTVAKIQGNSISSTAPAVGQVLQWNGSAWVPTTVSTSGGGGSSVTYYLNGSQNQTPTIGGLTYKELSKVPIFGAGTDFTINADGYIQSFITDVNDPSQLFIPAGNWNFEMWFSANSNGGTPSFYVELHKWDGTTLSLIADSSATPEGITNGIITDLYMTALAVPATPLAITDRLVIRVFVNHSSKIITLHTEDSHLCEIITAFPAGIASLNGLSAQDQSFNTDTNGTDFNIQSSGTLHTFNIPMASTASVTEGLITNTEYTTFNNKASKGFAVAMAAAL